MARPVDFEVHYATVILPEVEVESGQVGFEAVLVEAVPIDFADIAVADLMRLSVEIGIYSAGPVARPADFEINLFGAGG